jgi:hypothetical protein
LQEFVDVDFTFTEYGSQRALWNVARMVWTGELPVSFSMTPDLVTAGAGANKDKAELAEFAHDLTMPEA